MQNAQAWATHPQGQTCQTINVLWECTEYRHQRTQHEIEQGILEENEEKAIRLIRYLKNIGL
jgi:hypothetical protein